LKEFYKFTTLPITNKVCMVTSLSFHENDTIKNNAAIFGFSYLFL